MKPTISPVGDCAISIDFGQVIDPKINRQIRQVIEQIKLLQLDGIIELVPTYCALLVQYDAMVYTYSDICRTINPILQESVTDSGNERVTIVEIPTIYGGEYGPDLGFVASHNHISEAEVVSIHSGTDYLVYMLGFIPGFTYLGGMSEKIATPRLESPRLQIYPGSVGIAGKQTGMYPSMSPGGWRIIGRTPLKLYNPDSETPVYISSGDYIRYVSISEEEYNDILKKVENNEYKLNIRKIKRGELNA